MEQWVWLGPHRGLFSSLRSRGRVVLADLPCLHLLPGLGVLPIPVAGEGALSHHLPLWFDPMKSQLAFLLVF